MIKYDDEDQDFAIAQYSSGPVSALTVKFVKCVFDKQFGKVFLGNDQRQEGDTLRISTASSASC